MPRLLLAFDFDYTMADHDSEHFVLEQLAPDLFEKMRTLRDKHQWTDLMDMLLGDLHAKGVSPADIIQTLHRIPFSPAMQSALKLTAENNATTIIISDANTFYISEITKAKNVNDYISHVITNTGKFDESGRLRLTRHTIDPPHNCSRCSPNLCKGKELVEYIARNGPFDRVIYLGDGRNDFCPSTKLSSNDLLMARKGHALESMLNDKSYRSQITASIEFWSEADDVLLKFTQLFDSASK